VQGAILEREAVDELGWESAYDAPATLREAIAGALGRV
jgi:hypothetical protein